MFKNMKIGAKLGLGFSVVLVFLVAVAVMGIMRLADVNDKLDDITHKKIPQRDIVTAMMLNSNTIMVQIRNLLLTEDEAQNKIVHERIEEAKKARYEAHQKLIAMVVHPDGKKILEEIEKTLKPYVASYTKVIDLGLQNRNAEAYLILQNETRELQNKYFASLQAMADRQNALANESADQASAEYTSARNIMIGLTIFATIFSILIASFVARSITTPLNEALKVANAIAQGDMSINIVATSTEETGQLKSAMVNMLSTLKQLIADINEMGRQHDLGDIDIVIPVGNYQNDYRKMADGINKMVNGHIAVKKMAMGVVAEFGKGNFDAPLETLPGKKKFINDVMEELRRNLKNIEKETMALIDGVRDGELTKRANANQFQGGWHQIIGGVNNMLELIYNAAIVDGVGTLVKIANEGDFSVRIKTEYKNDYDTFKQAVNGVAEAIDKAIKEESAVFMALANGDFSKRITSNIWIGDLALVKSSANDMGDKLQATVAEVQNVMSKLANGDFKARITANLPGDFGAFKVSINGVAEAIDKAIMEESAVFSAMAGGDLTKRITSDIWVGDLALVKSSANAMGEKLQEVVIEVQNSAMQITSASEQVSGTAQSLSNGATEQASNLEETASAIEQMAGSINLNAENAKKTDEMASNASRMAQDGGKAVDQTVEAMKDIASKISIIEDIAYQTNLLALNAAIKLRVRVNMEKALRWLPLKCENLPNALKSPLKRSAKSQAIALRSVSEQENLSKRSSQISQKPLNSSKR